ncbi:hypothetical protein NC651_020623 [Populus alba x Populus x berolinensis]|nr:hypothetical protein NC651_020623 [Populus alba x Populus x berolinensis]
MLEAGLVVSKLVIRGKCCPSHTGSGKFLIVSYLASATLLKCSIHHSLPSAVLPSRPMAAMCDVLATETAIIYGLEPVWGSGFTWFLLGERMGAAPVLGKMFCPWLLFVVSFYLLIAILKRGSGYA